MKSFLKFFAVIVIAVSCSGCAAVVTHMGPLKSELKDGEAETGEFDHYSYSYTAEDNMVYLEKTPMCEQVREKIRVMKKKRRGLYFILAEIPLYGLGLVDMIYTYSISEHSRKEVPLAKYGTGTFAECGRKRPASGETLLIRNYREGIKERAETGEDGSVDLDEMLPGDVSGHTTFRISLEGDNPFYFYHTYYAD